MRLFAMIAALGLIATPVAAQLLGGGPGAGLGGLGGLGQLPNGLTRDLGGQTSALGLTEAARARVYADPLDIPEFAADTAIPDARALREIRRERLHDLVRKNARVLEEDPDRNPVRRGEIVAVDLAPADRQAILSKGFATIRQDDADLAGVRVEVLQPPAGMPLKRALALARATAPSAAFDYNSVFEPAGGPLLPKGGAPAQGGRPGGGAKLIGLVDGGVGAHPAFASASVEQRGFAGPVAATGHGTAVASLLVGSAPGFEGAARDARLLVADVYGGSPANGSAEAIARAIGWLSQRGVKVVNISLVGPPNQLLHAAIVAAQARGVVVVAAVGNDGPAAPPQYPASYPDVVAVTGVDARDRALVEAGRAVHLDFAAPGSDMAAALPGGGYAAVRGTSFAAPLVTARIAAQTGDPLLGLAGEARPGRGGKVGRGIVCDTCRNDPRRLKAKR